MKLKATFTLLVLCVAALVFSSPYLRDAAPTAHAQESLYGADGSVSAPGIAFRNNRGTGLYRSNVTGVAGFANAGTSVWTATVAGAFIPTNGIAAVSGLSASPRLVHTGGVPAQVSTAGTDATPVATEVYIVEVFVPANVTVTGVSVMNGSVASGNIKVGLANSSGAVVATSASTAMSGTDAYQRIPFTASYSAVGPATYYVLEFVDNNTARINTHTFGDFGAAKQTGQVYATGFTTITPPTTFTTALGPIASLY